MSWGIAVLLLILLHCRNQKASFQKLQFLGHAVRISEGREDVRSLLAGTIRPSDVSVRVEPWLNRAVSFAWALKFVSIDKGKSVALTEIGREVVTSINSHEDILSEERSFLKEVVPKLTETLVGRVWRMEDLL
jgi:ribosomal protein S7